MAEIWFYRPRSFVGRAVAYVTRGQFSHVSIMHGVADVAVVTEAHAVKGVWCQQADRVNTPDIRIPVDVSDAWATRWLVAKWGVQYGWMDALADLLDDDDAYDRKSREARQAGAAWAPEALAARYAESLLGLLREA
jgi:hypothetical protein